MLDDFTQINNLLTFIGTISFTVSGSLKAQKVNFDFLGVVSLGMITAVGGGALRDIILNKVPECLVNDFFLTVSFFCSLLIFGFLKFKKVCDFLDNNKNIKRTINITDAIGLATFTVSGSFIAINNDFSIYGTVILGTLTGVGGGIIRDILANEQPLVLKSDVYASICIVGSTFLYIAYQFINIISIEYIAYLLTVLMIVVRLLIIFYQNNKNKSIRNI